MILHRRHVNRWARWFDQVAPGWHRYVHPATIDQRHSAWCVVGQFTLYDNNRPRMEQLSEETRHRIWERCWERDIWRTRAFYFNRYRDAWREAVNKRRDADSEEWNGQLRVVEAIRAQMTDAWVLEGELATAGD